MSVRRNEVIFSLWIKKAAASKHIELKKWIRNSLGFTEKIKLDYRKHPKVVTSESKQLLQKQVLYIKKASE